MFILDILLQVTGAFYMFSGIVLARAVMRSRLLDKATQSIQTGPLPRAGRAQTIYSITLAVLTYLSGLGLLSLCEIAVHLFIATTAFQAAYLFWIAPSYLDTPETCDTRGRDQSVNAFVVFVAATAFVSWVASIGRLQPMAEASAYSMSMTAALVAVYLGYLAYLYASARLRS